ncbi:PAS domain S-box protein [Amaricoccus solimangrovi]|uniref:histidine kinase n=1 Tax=Amaricoccus solimangrovi TaxID=2589815 RepID=A0A501WHK2_9RHOB|nr:PAS domain S-box protein [Amaricoccus solimangrovi]TPE49363.1 PAS domain S-box protein [Amaricoccus solimangrovi]
MQIQENVREHLAAIVEGSDDAIITKTLDGVIRSWNPSAEGLFGYAASEVIGQPIDILIPENLRHEEVEFVSRLRRGERIRHFETVRRRKNGSLVPISLTVSPVRDDAGVIVGASKIARDISTQKEMAERQHAILAEMMHRVRNCFAVAGGLVGICARDAGTASELADRLRGRFLALSSIQSMAIPDPADTSRDGTTLWAMLEVVMKPFVGATAPRLEGEDVPVCHAAITPLALVFYELCTNAVKYGAFGQERGLLTVTATRRSDRLLIRWHESAAFDIGSADGPGGFGTRMCEASMRSALDGSIAREITPRGMTALLDLDLASVTGEDEAGD